MPDRGAFFRYRDTLDGMSPTDELLDKLQMINCEPVRVSPAVLTVDAYGHHFTATELVDGTFSVADSADDQIVRACEDADAAIAAMQSW